MDAEDLPPTIFDRERKRKNVLLRYNEKVDGISGEHE
jgi:hypothetical protein